MISDPLYNLARNEIERLAKRLNALEKQGYDSSSIEYLRKRLNHCRKLLDIERIEDAMRELCSIRDEIDALELLGKNFVYSVDQKAPDFSDGRRYIELWTLYQPQSHVNALRHVNAITHSLLRTSNHLFQVVYDPYTKEFIEFNMHEIPQGVVRSAVEMVINTQNLQQPLIKTIEHGISKRVRKKFKDKRGIIMISLRRVETANPDTISEKLGEYLQAHGSREPYSKLDGVILLHWQLDKNDKAFKPAIFVIPNPHASDPISPREFVGPVAPPLNVHKVHALAMRVHIAKPGLLHDTIGIEEGYIVINDRKIAPSKAFDNPEALGAFTGILGRPRNITKLFIKIGEKKYDVL